MRIAVEGCCHGELDTIYSAIKSREDQNGYKVDLLLICGDFQSIRNEADLETIACPRKYLDLGTFHKYYSGERTVPIPTIFIGGNHESSNYLWELYHGGWACPGIYFLGFGGVINVGGLRIGGMSGIYKAPHYKLGHFEISPYDDSHKRSIYHVRRYDVYKMLQVKEPMDIFLSHDWPLGIEQYGDVQKLMRMKKYFVQEIKENKLGSIAYEHVLSALRPAHWFSAHLHVRFAAVVHWGERPAELMPQQSTPPAVSVPLETSEPIRNPDEIGISLDDEDEQAEEVEEIKDVRKKVNDINLNPDEIAIELDSDEDDDQEQQTTSAQPPASSRSSSQAGPIPDSLTTGSRAKPYPTSTKFLALDKCMAHRDYLEIIDFPEINEPVEFYYDEEWLAIVRTLDSYLSLKYTQPPPIEGDHLRSTLQSNREWVRTNISQKQGLAIPNNFQKTAPAHDPIRTMGPQQKRDNILPFLNPQTVEFCEMLQIPNKINPNGRRA